MVVRVGYEPRSGVAIAEFAVFPGALCSGRCRREWWPGIASVQSDDAGSSVEREVRCEPAYAGRLDD
jgi:hypothetical protein